MKELFAELLEPVGYDIGGDEFPIRRRRLPSITLDDVARFVCDDVLGSPKPRPPVTAYEGFEGDAYWKSNGVWVHCLTGEPWNAD